MSGNDEKLPAPLVGPEVDVRDLDGFMLNVERLMASELVALSSHEVIAAALFLWCRAWKQLPAASLPNDDRVLAAYARLPMPRFRKLKGEVLRGFVRCLDGRLYHRTLAELATAAFARKRAFKERREKDADRLRQWREKQDGNANETRSQTQSDTSSETRFVAEGEGEGGEREGNIKERNAAGPPLRDGNAGDQSLGEVVPAPNAELFRRGKEILGKTSGGLIRKLLTAKGENVALARAALEMASQAGDAREYLGAIIAGRDRDSAQLSARDRGDAW